MKFRVSKKIMRPYVTLLNIFSEIAHKASLHWSNKGDVLFFITYSL